MRQRVLSLSRRLAALLCCLLLASAALPATAAVKKTLTVSFTATTYQNRARELLKQLNAYRAQNGAEALQTAADLDSAALQRAAELFVDYDHNRPDGTEYDTVLAAYPSLQGYEACAESAAAGFSKAADVLASWQEDGADALLDGDFTHAGLACVMLEDSYNEYYWALLLVKLPGDFSGKAADATAKAGKSKTMKVEISTGVLQKPDDTHGRFELRVNNLNLKTKQTASPTVSLYDRKGVKIGKCQLEDLTYKSSNTALFTVSAQGEVKRKKTGTGTLTISHAGLSSAKCTVTIGSGASSSASASSGTANSAAVTAATIGDREPALTATEYAKTVKLSVYVRGASGYVLYRSSAKSGSYTKVTEKATTKRWDYSLDREDVTKTSYYKVRAYKNSNGKRVYSEYSDPVKVAP